MANIDRHVFLIQTDPKNLMKSKKKIAHLSSAHGDRDVRIFLKECTSLAEHGFDVHLVLSGVEERTENNVTIHSVPYHNKNRKHRMTKTVKDVLRKALEINADIYHLHDPELLQIALKLKRKGKKVIYDAHEDLPRQIMGKSYLKFKKIIGTSIEKYENYVAKRMDGIITATPFIRDRFLKVNPNTVDINNFPLSNEIEFTDTVIQKENKICFIGNISSIRGIIEVVKALEQTDIRLDLAGEIPEDLKRILVALPAWHKVNELGFVNRQQSLEIKLSSIAGIVTFLPLPNHINAQPNKIFEYMASGLPVIGSNFPLWTEIIEKNNCGICVDPEDPQAIAKAINYLINNPEEALIMGERGKKLVRERYNWDQEKIKLIKFYEQILST
jgi:glycosyltransferase involved in cell wall biosynthesis